MKFIVSIEELKIDLEKINIILILYSPESVIELRSFIGAC